MILFLNVVWLILGGAVAGFSYILSGICLCLTVIGFPFGIRAIQLGMMVMLPFGKAFSKSETETGCVARVFNIIWLLSTGWFIALTHIVFGSILAITVLGIPFAIQHFKLAPVALFPFNYRLHVIAER